MSKRARVRRCTSWRDIIYCVLMEIKENSKIFIFIEHRSDFCLFEIFFVFVAKNIFLCSKCPPVLVRNETNMIAVSEVSTLLVLVLSVDLSNEYRTCRKERINHVLKLIQAELPFVGSV